MCLDYLIEVDTDGKEGNDQQIKNVLAFTKKLFEQPYLLSPLIKKLCLKLSNCKNKLVRQFAIESIVDYIKSGKHTALARIVKARLYDAEAKCRVAAIRGC